MLLTNKLYNFTIYVQQPAQLCRLRSGRELRDEIIDEALESLVLQLSLLFQNTTKSLPTVQVNFLKALVDGVEKLTSKDTIDKYHLNSSANIIRVKQALVHKEIIDEQMTGKPEIIDPGSDHPVTPCRTHSSYISVCRFRAASPRFGK